MVPEYFLAAEKIYATLSAHRTFGELGIGLGSPGQVTKLLKLLDTNSTAFNPGRMSLDSDCHDSKKEKVVHQRVARRGRNWTKSKRLVCMGMGLERLRGCPAGSSMDMKWNRDGSVQIVSALPQLWRS